MKRVIVCVFTLIITLSAANSQQFRYLRPQDGLYDGEINSIGQDAAGKMWFATWSGLISYDGISFRLYRPEIGNPESLPDKKVKKLFIDSKDNLWVVTSRSLCRYNKEKDSFVTIEFERAFVNPVFDILSLSELNGDLIIHTAEGLFIYPLDKISDPEYKAASLKVTGEGEMVRFSYSTSVAGNLYLVSDSRAPISSTVYKAVLDTNSTGMILDATKYFTVPDKVNDIVYVEPENNLYITTVNGVLVYSLIKDGFVKKRYFEGVDVRQALYATDHKLYCSTTTTELLYIDLHLGLTGKYIANPNQYGSLQYNNIHTLFEDFSGNLWIGHQGQGLSIKNLYLKEFYTYRKNPMDQKPLMSNTIMCFNGTNDEVLIGCRSGGLNVMKKNPGPNSKPAFDHVTFKQQNNNVAFSVGIWNIAKESDSLFWVGTDIGLLKLIKNRGRWEFDQSEPPIYKGIARKIFIDDNSNIWCGTWTDGLIFIPALKNNPNRIIYRYMMNPNDKESLSDDFVQSILLDSKGRFWIGTVNGLNLLEGNYESHDLSGNVKPDLKFKRYIAEKSESSYLNNNEINCIFENYDGKIWLATQGGGINILDPDKDSFSHITTDDGLPSDDVLGILRDDVGDLWISTNKGLVSYNQYNTAPDLTIYDSSDGIQGNIFMVNSYYKAMDGEMFFGGDNGFSCFFPNHIKPNEIKPRVALTNLMVANNVIGIGDSINDKVVLEKSLDMTSDIRLPYKDNSFSIGVSSIHYQNPGGNKIRYMMEGYNKYWITVPATNRYAYFSHLPPGKYTFKVKAVSSDNVESANVKTLMVEILPPWYRTWYMRIIFLLAATGVFGVFILIIVNRQRLVFEKKIDKIAFENNENKMVFLTNIAHELRTPLSLVIAPIDDILQNYKNIDPLWKNHLHLIYRNSRYLLKLINQIVDFRKLNAGKLKLSLQETDIVRLIKDVVLNFKYMESRRKVNLSINVPANKVIISVDAQKIEEVLYNLLSNAFKHTADFKAIVVSLQLLDPDKSPVDGSSGHKRLKITVFNEGREISDEEKEKIFERFYKVDESIEGAGIGLSFSKSLVELHNGKFEVESRPGKGVSFNIYLPFNEVIVKDYTVTEKFDDIVAEQYVFTDAEEHLPVHRSSEDGKKSSIVIVEDNYELRSFLKMVLLRTYNCYDAGDGIEGWKLTKEVIPDVVVSDIIMPNKDGYQLCRQIKDNLKTCHIPVILLTAKNADDQVIAGYNLGADAYVTKPFDINLILTQISRLIKNRELIREKYITQNFMVEVSKTNPSKDDKFILGVRAILEENISDSDFNVKKLSSQLNISTTQMYRKLKVLTGYSPVEFIRVIKLQKAYNLLNTKDNTVKEVCYLSGFNNLSYFIKCFREHFGITPASYRDKGFVEQFKSDNTNITNMT